MPLPAPGPIHLRAGGVSVVLVTDGGRLPAVLHWGADLGDMSAADLAELVDAGVPATVPNDLDQVTRAGILAEHAAGWNGRPGLVGQRAGRAWSPLFTLTDLDVEHAADGGGPRAGRRPRHRGRPRGAPGAGAAAVGRPAPAGHGGGPGGRGVGAVRRGRARTDAPGAPGRHRAVRPRRALGTGARAAAGAVRRRHPLAGEPPRPHRPGRPADPRRRHGGLRLLRRRGVGGPRRLERQPRQLRRAPLHRRRRAGRRRAAAARRGAARAGGVLHRPVGLRRVRHRAGRHRGSVPHHAAGEAAPPEQPPPGRAQHLGGRLLRPRPRPARRARAASAPTSAWSATCSTTAGSATAATTTPVWATGTWTRRSGPRACTRWCEEVRQRGMEFGLWVEPEMVNPDSDLARAHPDWILQTGGRMPIPSRHQQVLDLAHPDAYAYILGRLDALLTEYPISYLKWDHNRDLRRRRARPARRARRARPDPRRLPADRRAARPAPRRRDRVLLVRRAAGWTWRSWSAPTGSGAAT